MVPVPYPAPELRAHAVMPGGDVRELCLADHGGRWVVVMFYPRDFTAVCPTEIVALSKRAPELAAIGATAIAISVDDVETHGRWIREQLGPLAIPLAADPTRENSARWNALLEPEGVAARATFVVDPRGTVRYAAFHDLAVGRSISELLRVVEALQTGQASPADWRRGEPTLGK